LQRWKQGSCSWGADGRQSFITFGSLLCRSLRLFLRLYVIYIPFSARAMSKNLKHTLSRSFFSFSFSFFDKSFVPASSGLSPSSPPC
jgi:hypothetical protein